MSSIENCGNGQIAYFLHLLIQSFWVPCDLSSKNFSKKIYYLKLRFMCQDMPRMQYFAPFTTELLGAISGPPVIRTTSQARWASPLRGLDWTT
jgi:hypothetical protein